MRSKLKEFQLFPKEFGFFPLLFLLYLAFPIFYMLGTSGAKQFFGFMMLAIFIISYRQLYFAVNGKTFPYWIALQLGIIVILTIGYSPFNMLMGFFPANFIGWHANKRNFRIAWLALTLVILLGFMSAMIQASQLGADMIMLGVFCLVMIFAPFATRSMYIQMELRSELDLAKKKIEELVKREERTRIARDLHDTLGHTLSLITLKSQLVEKLVTKSPEKAKLEAKEIESTSRIALKQLRELVSDMRSMTLAEELVQVEAILNAAGIEPKYKGDVELKDASQLTQNILSLCLREAVTNVVKHSQATSCLIELKKAEGEVSLVVKDNGIGALEVNHHGNGLNGIKERLSLIDGRLSLKVDQGTTVKMTVPIVIRQNQEEEQL
ncbi:two-component system sensor histidine kinase DesK [Bacillus horti]|uniref:histidine kinase n=1 Tax=Caldalkalibacillus horti TaxID=77523 RepID=A0ABT9VVM3_9BACI|nr:two-component system sensor histidine kinase DesK [Bacillus horti]